VTAVETPKSELVITVFERTCRFLSNFAAGPVEMYGEHYATVEHAFQAAKWPPVKGERMLSGRHAARRADIAICRSPAEAKQLGGERIPDLPIVEGWDEKREGVMLELVRRKFTQTVPLGRALLSTWLEGPDVELEQPDGKLVVLGPRCVLVEGNRDGDRDWGAVPVYSLAGVAQVQAEYPGALVWRYAKAEDGKEAWLTGRNMLGRALMQVREELRGG
jgi:predicted NAD-dependent protein-ADP-ribosyltransferase YbiA (DUF1768 family)